MDGLGRLGVNAEENPMEINVTSAPGATPTPTTLASSSIPWAASPTVLTPTETNGTQVPSLAPVELEKEAIPVLFDLVMESSDTASLHQLSKDVDGLLENYLFRNLKSRQGDTWDIRDVLLTVTVTTRRRRLQGTREVAFRVDGNVLVDVDTTTCADCANEAIQSDLDELVTVEALDTVVVRSLQQVTRVKQVREVEESQSTSTPDSSNSLQETTSETEQLQRPSTLSIVFGFALTGIAFLGLVFYAYIFYRKRQKRLRKLQQQRQSIEYRLPPPRVAPATPSQALSPPPNKQQRVSPSVVPTSTSTAPRDENSVASPFKVVVDTDTVVSDAPTDDFARELQLAATLDEQAWEDFQRKKMALDQNKQIPPPSFSTVGSVSPIPVPVPAPESNPQSWTKSFPYGDEVPEEQGVEWIPETTPVSAIAGDAWMPYNVNKKVVQPQENNQEGLATSRGRRDPEPAVFGPSSAVLQSIGRTLSQYPESNENSVADESFLTEDESECVDEVARLTRYVQRLEKQKERRKQLESTRQVPPAMGTREQVNGPSSLKYTENNGYLNNMRSPPTHAQDQRPRYEASIKPGAPRYTGITMAGGLYQDPSLIILDPADSMSEDSDDNQSLRSHERLGITPFSVQNAAASQAYNGDPISPTMTSKGRDGDPVYNGRNRQIVPIDNSRTNPNIINRGTRNSTGGLQSRQPPPVRLSELRTNQAIIDDSQSDANFVTFSDAGSDPIPSALIPRSTHPTSAPSASTARKSFFNNPPSKPREPPKSNNQKFSKLRSLFEERPKNAVFPPDENWQSNGMLKT